MKRNLFASLGALLLISCAAAPQPSVAQTADIQLAQQTGTRVIVMGEDSDANSVVRTSNIYKRVLAELASQLGRHGYRMVDEEMLAVDFGWRITQRRPKTELIEGVKLANTSGNAAQRARVMTLFRIFAAARSLDFATRIETRIEGELYDVANNQLLDSYELPRSVYSAPASCNATCLTETVGDKARDIATSLAEILAVKLRQHASAAGAPSGAVATATGGDAAGMVTTYTLTFRNFPTAEIMSIVNVMRDEFPGYSSHNVLEQRPAVARYEYVSTAKATKIQEWLALLLMDMGIEPDRQAALIVRDNQVMIDKIVGAPPAGPARAQPTGRFR